MSGQLLVDMTCDEDVFAGFANLKTIDVTDLQKLRGLLEDLLEMDISTREGILEFFRKRDELEKHFETERHESYFLMTADVADRARKERYEWLEKQLTPLMEAYANKLNRKLLDSGEMEALPAPFDVVRRNVKAEVQRFRPENLELQKEIESICIEITELQGKLTVKWEGREVALPEIDPFVQGLDRDVRKRAFEASLEAKRSIAGTIDEKFNRLVRLRHQMAVNSGYEHYIPFRYQELRRFDWNPGDCLDFHQAVRQHLFPLRDKLRKQRLDGLGLEALRPYDLSCDIRGREPLKLYEKGDSASLVDGTEKIIDAMDGELSGYFKQVRDHGLLDLDVRNNKASTAYMVTYPVYRQASVFFSGTGLADDLLVLLHELGHCFHYFLSMDIFPSSSLDWSAEVAEIGSMGIELMGLEELEAYLDPAKAARLKEDRLRQTIYYFISMAHGDEFQHWIYTHPDHSAQERHNKWLELGKIYWPGINRDGYASVLAQTGWQFLHILQIPFYMIDYAISELAALTLWDRYRTDPRGAISLYKRGCSLKGSRPVPQVFEAFGTTFSFGEGKIKPLAGRLAAELNL